MPYILPALKNSRYPKTGLPTLEPRYTDINRKHGIDLIQEEIEVHAKTFSKYLI